SVARKGGLQLGHFLLEHLRVRSLVLAVILVNFGQSFDVGFFAPRGARVRCGSLLGLLDSYATGIQVSVVPKSMIVRHGDSPVSHGTCGILLRDLQESFASSFILKRMQQRYRAIKRR